MNIIKRLRGVFDNNNLTFEFITRRSTLYNIKTNNTQWILLNTIS